MNLSYSVGDDPSNVDRNRLEFFGKLGIPVDALAVPQQIHSSHAVTATSPGRYRDCDALATSKPGVFCCVTVADCVPILLLDPSRSVVAAIHAGWRGTLGNILTKTVEHLIREWNSAPVGIRAFIGPAAGKCCYEVGEDVGRRFGREFTAEINGTIHLDLKAANKAQLIGAGVPMSQIEESPECTICNTSFHSFRRDGPKSGRMMAAIGIRAVK